MKKQAFLFIIFIVFCSCSKDNKNTSVRAIHDTVLIQNKDTLLNCSKTKSNDFVFSCLQIHYAKPIEGYKVSVLWYPEIEVSSGVIGKAILHFEFKNGINFNLTHNFFVSSIINANPKTGSPIINPTKTIYSIDNYYSSNNTNFLTDCKLEPFFFEDVNFDGKKELLLTKSRQGQRFVNTFEVYLIDKDGGLVDDLYQITRDMPFAALDAHSVINVKNKTINIYTSGGANNWSNKLYTIDSKETESCGKTIFKLTVVESCDDGVVSKRIIK